MASLASSFFFLLSLFCSSWPLVLLVSPLLLLLLDERVHPNLTDEDLGQAPADDEHVVAVVRVRDHGHNRAIADEHLNKTGEKRTEKNQTGDRLRRTWSNRN